MNDSHFAMVIVYPIEYAHVFVALFSLTVSFFVVYSYHVLTIFFRASSHVYQWCNPEGYEYMDR